MHQTETDSLSTRSYVARRGRARGGVGRRGALGEKTGHGSNTTACAASAPPCVWVHKRELRPTYCIDYYSLLLHTVLLIDRVRPSSNNDPPTHAPAHSLCIYTKNIIKQVYQKHHQTGLLPYQPHIPILPTHVLHVRCASVYATVRPAPPQKHTYMRTPHTHPRGENVPSTPQTPPINHHPTSRAPIPHNTTHKPNPQHPQTQHQKHHTTMLPPSSSPPPSCSPLASTSSSRASPRPSPLTSCPRSSTTCWYAGVYVHVCGRMPPKKIHWHKHKT